MNNTLAYPEIRGWILKILYTSLPEYAGDQLLSQLLMDGGYKVPPPLVQGHLRYLAEKGYVDLKDANIDEIGLSRQLGKLTSKGVDFVEGNLPEEPGLVRR